MAFVEIKGYFKAICESRNTWQMVVVKLSWNATVMFWVAYKAAIFNSACYFHGIIMYWPKRDLGLVLSSCGPGCTSQCTLSHPFCPGDHISMSCHKQYNGT